MQIFFSLLCVITAALFVTAFFFAAISPDRLYHFYFGLIATVSVLLTHTWVFFYFIGSGQGIREGVLANKLDEKHIRTTKKFKGRTFPFAFFAIVFAIVGAVMGGALRAGRVSVASHWGWVLLAVAFNLFAFRQEYRTIRENDDLMKRLNGEIEKKA